MAPKKTYHHGNLRTRLIETALDIIEEHGLEKVSMRELGNRIGVSRTAPYRHFANKSELLSAIAEEGFSKLTGLLNRANDAVSDDSLARLMNTGIAYVEFAVANPVHYRMMFGNEIPKAGRTPTLLAAADGAFNALLRAVRACRDEEKIKDFDPVIIANMLWAMTHGISTLLIDGQVAADNAFHGLPALLQTGTGPGGPDIRRIFESMGEIMFSGLAADADIP